jgi:hypothetical protein
VDSKTGGTESTIKAVKEGPGRHWPMALHSYLAFYLRTHARHLLAYEDLRHILR